MIIKTKEKVRLLPARKGSYTSTELNSGKPLTEHGWLDIPSEGEGLWLITDWHSFDDFGATMETLTIQRSGESKEIYSYNEGETFTFDIE